MTDFRETQIEKKGAKSMLNKGLVLSLSFPQKCRCFKVWNIILQYYFLVVSYPAFMNKIIYLFIMFLTVFSYVLLYQFFPIWPSSQTLFLLSAINITVFYMYHLTHRKTKKCGKMFDFSFALQKS